MTDLTIYAEPSNPALPDSGFELDPDTPRSSSPTRRSTSSVRTA